jgi:hypothetical protein
MAEEINMYESPASPPVSEEAEAARALSSDMLSNLAEAAPWMRFLGILGFIGAGFTALAGVSFLIVCVAGGLSSLSLGSLDAAFLGAAGLGGGVIYFGAGLLLFLPSKFAYTAGAKLRSYALTNNGRDLESAFKNNRMLWKFAGVFTIVCIAALPVLVIIAIIIGVMI